MRLNIKKSVQSMLAKNKVSNDPGWDELQQRYELALTLRNYWDQINMLNMAFFVGKQYSFFNSATWSVQQLRDLKGRIRNVDNQLMPRVRRQIADGIKNDPMMSVVPATTDEEDIKAAKIGDKVLKAVWRNMKMPRKNRRLRTWVHVCGNGFLFDYWDPRGGPMTRGEDGALKYQGDVEAQVYGPFNIGVPFTSIGEAELDDFPWITISEVKGIEWFDHTFKNKEVTPEEIPPHLYQSDAMFGITVGASSMEIPRAILKRLFLKPCKAFPKGLMIVGANRTVLLKEDYPYNTFPVEHFKDVDIPGVFWGMSTMQFGIPLQKAWNRTLTGYDEFNRTLGKGKMLIPRGSDLEVAPDDTHGEHIYYKPVMGYKPEIMTLKGLPDSYDRLIGLLQASLDNLFSQHEVSRGTNKSDIRSGEMVNLLLEQDAHGGIPSRATFEEGYERCMSRILRRIKEGYSDERVLQIRGKEGEFEIFAFKGAQLRDNTDVMIKRESSMPDSRLGRERQILDKFRDGLYGHPADPEVRRHVMNMLEDAVVTDVYADTRLDEANARVENVTLMSGQPLMVNIYDDHGIHLKELNHFRKTRDYQKLKQDPKAFTTIDGVFSQHEQMHKKFIAEMMAAMVEREQTQQKGPSKPAPAKGGGK